MTTDDPQTNRSRQGAGRRKGPPIKGLFGAVVVILYWLAVPTLNAKLGLNLPELRQWKQAGGERPVDRGSERETAAANDATAEVADDTPPLAADRQVPQGRGDAEGRAASLVGTHGYLRELEADRFLSPAGLMYTPGSQEGHRLRHIGRHLADQPQRPGLHGVFEGTMAEFLRAIDSAYELARQGGRSVEQETDGDREVYTVDLGKRIGYVGGREGNRRQQPAAKSLRLVLEGKRVITAFPL